MPHRKPLLFKGSLPASEGGPEWTDMRAMSRSVLLLATHHQFQGPKFRGYIEDTSYRVLVKTCISVRRIDFMFEEAGTRGPSVAEECANSVLGIGRYLNMDQQRNDLRKYGIAEDVETTTSHWIDESDKSVGGYDQEHIDAHERRETRWLHGIEAKQFEKGMVICGVGHSLSFAFRLKKAGFSPVELFTYLPYQKLCTKPHAE